MTSAVRPSAPSLDEYRVPDHQPQQKFQTLESYLESKSVFLVHGRINPDKFPKTLPELRSEQLSRMDEKLAEPMDMVMNDGTRLLTITMNECVGIVEKIFKDNPRFGILDDVQIVGGEVSEILALENHPDQVFSGSDFEDMPKCTANLPTHKPRKRSDMDVRFILKGSTGATRKELAIKLEEALAKLAKDKNPDLKSEQYEITSQIAQSGLTKFACPDEKETNGNQFLIFGIGNRKNYAFEMIFCEHLTKEELFSPEAVKISVRNRAFVIPEKIEHLYKVWQGLTDRLTHLLHFDDPLTMDKFAQLKAFSYFIQDYQLSSELSEQILAKKASEKFIDELIAYADEHYHHSLVDGVAYILEACMSMNRLNDQKLERAILIRWFQSPHYRKCIQANLNPLTTLYKSYIEKTFKTDDKYLPFALPLSLLMFKTNNQDFPYYIFDNLHKFRVDYPDIDPAYLVNGLCEVGSAAHQELSTILKVKFTPFALISTFILKYMPYGAQYLTNGHKFIYYPNIFEKDFPSIWKANFENGLRYAACYVKKSKPIPPFLAQLVLETKIPEDPLLHRLFVRLTKNIIDQIVKHDKPTVDKLLKHVPECSPTNKVKVTTPQQLPLKVVDSPAPPIVKLDGETLFKIIADGQPILSDFQELTKHLTSNPEVYPPTERMHKYTLILEKVVGLMEKENNQNYLPVISYYLHLSLVELFDQGKNNSVDVIRLTLCLNIILKKYYFPQASLPFLKEETCEFILKAAPVLLKEAARQNMYFLVLDCVEGCQLRTEKLELPMTCEVALPWIESATAKFSKGALSKNELQFLSKIITNLLKIRAEAKEEQLTRLDYSLAALIEGMCLYHEEHLFKLLDTLQSIPNISQVALNRLYQTCFDIYLAKGKYLAAYQIIRKYKFTDIQKSYLERLVKGLLKENVDLPLMQFLAQIFKENPAFSLEMWVSFFSGLKVCDKETTELVWKTYRESFDVRIAQEGEKRIIFWKMGFFYLSKFQSPILLEFLKDRDQFNQMFEGLKGFDELKYYLLKGTAYNLPKELRTPDILRELDAIIVSQKNENAEKYAELHPVHHQVMLMRAETQDHSAFQIVLMDLFAELKNHKEQENLVRHTEIFNALFTAFMTFDNVQTESFIDTMLLIADSTIVLSSKREYFKELASCPQRSIRVGLIKHLSDKLRKDSPESLENITGEFVVQLLDSVFNDPEYIATTSLAKQIKTFVLISRADQRKLISTDDYERLMKKHFETRLKSILICSNLEVRARSFQPYFVDAITVYGEIHNECTSELVTNQCSKFLLDDPENAQLGFRGLSKLFYDYSKALIIEGGGELSWDNVELDVEDTYQKSTKGEYAAAFILPSCEKMWKNEFSSRKFYSFLIPFLNMLIRTYQEQTSLPMRGFICDSLSKYLENHLNISYPHVIPELQQQLIDVLEQFIVMVRPDHGVLYAIHVTHKDALKLLMKVAHKHKVFESNPRIFYKAYYLFQQISEELEMLKKSVDISAEQIVALFKEYLRTYANVMLPNGDVFHLVEQIIKVNSLTAREISFVHIEFNPLYWALLCFNEVRKKKGIEFGEVFLGTIKKLIRPVSMQMVKGKSIFWQKTFFDLIISKNLVDPMRNVTKSLLMAEWLSVLNQLNYPHTAMISALFNAYFKSENIFTEKLEFDVIPVILQGPNRQEKQPEG